MRSKSRYFLYLVWVSSAFTLGVFIFTSGFLLKRQVLPNETVCKDRGCNQPPTVFKKAVILVIDALKYEFCVYNTSLGGGGGGTKSARKSSVHQLNQLPVLDKLTKPNPSTGQVHGKLFRFMADPPTTTMQRLKGLTTGSLPTFIDVSANFASYQIQEDSFINQLVRNNKSIHFSGDDTWISLYPDSFKKSDPQPSFDVWDLDTVDNNVKKFVYSELKGDWDVLLGHFLGVDHAGHKFGPNHPEMGRKLKEMNVVIETVVKNLPKDTVLFVLGDHGMTSSGDHGGDSQQELEAALFVYGLKLGFPEHQGPATVSQIDLVPTVSLLLGIPVPFSNLGMVIDELFIPTMLLKEEKVEDGFHTRLSSFSSDDLVKFRLSYIKSNVHQVHRYLTAYLAAGGHFPEKLNSKVRKLASEVINRPGALSPRESLELYNKCKEFLQAAKQMCQAVWVNFDDQAITVGLTFMVLHLSILSLVVCKPQTRLLSTLISGFLLIYIGASILLGSLFGASLAVIAELFESWTESLYNMESLILYSAGFFTVLTNGMCLLWKLRYCLKDTVDQLVTGLALEPLLAAFIYFLISVSVFSNSFVINESNILSFGFVSLLCLFFILHARKSLFLCLLVLLSDALVRISCIYIRCREEHGPECQLTQFHKPLSTLDHETSFYRNWRYFFTLATLFSLCLCVHLGLSRAGNLNGISCSVLTAKYLPWIISVMMASYWALQSFPSPLVSKLLPWQHNLLVHLVFLLSTVGAVVLVASPRLVYLQTRKRGLSRIITKQDNIPCYFNYIKANWRSNLTDKCQPSIPLGYGLGSCLSAPYFGVGVFVVLISMLLAGDGQCPAVFIQFLLMFSILIISAHIRLNQVSSLSGLLRVPFSSLVLWSLLEHLSFYTTGHQATFPHIQWSAAFIGLEGGQIAGESYSGHILPALLVGWNTFSSSLLSAFLLPLLLLAPFHLNLLLPQIRQQQPQHQNGAGPLLTGTINCEIERGESLLLDKPEETTAALFVLSLQYILLKGFRLFCSMLAAAVLRRHLMVWKIFAPKFIFEGVGFFVSLAGILIGYLVFGRIFNVVSNNYSKSKIS